MEIGRKQPTTVIWEPEGCDPVEVQIKAITALDELRLDEAVKSVGPEATRQEQYRATIEVMADAIVGWSLKGLEFTRENVVGMLCDYSEFYGVISRAFMGRQGKKKLSGPPSSGGHASSSSTLGSNAESTTTEARTDLTGVTTSTG